MRWGLGLAAWETTATKDHADVITLFLRHSHDLSQRPREGVDPSCWLRPKQLVLNCKFHVFSFTFKIMRFLLSVP